MWWIYALLSAFFAALTVILAKVGIKDVNSDLATAIRTIVIMMLAWLIVFSRGQINLIQNISRYTLAFLIMSGIATGLSWLFYFKALQLGEVSKVASLDKLSVVMAIILSVIFLNETLTWQMAIGAGLIVLGAIILIL